MTDLAHSPHPLVFPVGDLPPFWRPSTGGTTHPLVLRTSARALTGMQKEAVVAAPTGPAWRMVCDEGPYLLGTDLAPFPLAFFCVGMVSGYFTELAALAAQHGIAGDWQLQQHNRYTMEGSATAGTMRGSALPVELQLEAAETRVGAALAPLLIDAVSAAPAGALLATSHSGAFSLQHNGRAVLPAGSDHRLASMQLPAEFATLLPADTLTFPPDIIVKTQSAPLREGVTGGVGSSLTNEQKRTLHMQGSCLRRQDGLLEVIVELFSPLGSRFRFLVEPDEQCSAPRAPSPAMYLSAGIAFCFLTQMGRYAHIVRQPLDDYRIVQDSAFALPGASCGTGKACSADALATGVYITSSGNDDYARRVVSMSEQTCFLHAACRQQVPVRVKPPQSSPG